ncbi:hypothetical protein [Thermodesulfovibrio yellowstonii]|uniref:SurA N-terminal domain-containing protein n=1 Tax=Thermodesulfovibrio yellowstonii TaxID=28262 RepID=A0A9W6GGL2_9BACT|nr:hypothetical protein [Thermodesulfovibrio islandicus]GLI53595.1 hypothetical protein TISLANDTSLP1_12880 [Thermodesulfovibrio islandicus]
MVKFILALATLFNVFIVSSAFSEIIDRVVAYVDSNAITLRDFEKVASKMKEKIPQIKNQEILETMINRVLLLRKAKELFVEGKDEELINNYVDLKIKSGIIIPESKIREYYEENKTKFKDTPYIYLRDEIEKYLFEKEFNQKLKEYIEELRQDTEIKIIFIP